MVPEPMCGILDCHCHIGVTAELHDALRLAAAIAAAAAARPLQLHVMSSNATDLAVLEQLVARDDSGSVVPYFGIHPWYSHLFCATEHVDKAQHYQSVLSPAPDHQLLAQLPSPMYLGHHMNTVRRLARQCAAAGTPYGVGEIGLDRLFRLPSSGFYGNPAVCATKVRLTACKVTMAHQQHVLATQLQVALELGVAVSLHCVKAHGALYEAVTGGFGGISAVALHSYSGSTEQARMWVAHFRARRRALVFSFSHAINGPPARLAALQQLVALLDDRQIVVESDWPLDEYFLRDPDAYYRQLHHMVQTLGAAKNRTAPQQAAVMHAAALQLTAPNATRPEHGAPPP